MKNIKKVIAMLLILTTLTGCIKSKTEMTINKDKSMVFETSYLISDKMLEYSQQTTDDVFTQEQLDYLKKRNLTYEKKSDNGYTGYVLKKVYDNIDNISNDIGKEVELSDYLNEDFDDSVFFKVEKGFLKNKYTASFKYNLEYNDFNDLSYNTQSNNNELAMGTGFGETTTPNTTIDNTTTPSNGTLTTPDNGTNDNTTTIIGDDSNNITSTDEPDYGELTKLASEMEISYAVNLPEKAISNNATESQNDGKKLVWKLSPDSENKIEYVFEVKNMTNYYILYGGIAAGVIIVALIIIMIIKKGKKGKEVVPAQDKPIHADYDPSIAAAIPNPALVNGSVNQTVNNEMTNTNQSPVVQPEQSVNGPIGNTNTEPQAYIIPEVTVEPQMVQPEVKPTFITPENMPEEPVVVQEPVPEVKIETPQTTNISQN